MALSPSLLNTYLDLCNIDPKKNHRDVIFTNGSRLCINVFGSVVFLHKNGKMFRVR